MRTTSVVVEHLAIGVQAFLWIAMAVAAYFGYDWMLTPAPLTQFVILTLALFVVYPVGVFMDEFSDYIFHHWSLVIRKKYLQDDTQTTFALLVHLKDASTAQYFQYLRSRIRIARSSVVNFALLTGVSLVFTVRQLSEQLGSLTTSVIVAEIVIGTILTGLAFFSWRQVSHTFAKRIKWGYFALQVPERKRRKKST